MSSLMEEPALDPPPGVTPNFIDTGGDHAVGYGIIIASSLISTLAVVARLVSSAIAKKFVIEDFLMVAALGVFAGNQYITYDLTIYPGMWTHQWNIQNGFLPHFLYNIHLGAVFYGPCAMCIKVAILVNWLRVFVPRDQRNHIWWILQILIWTNVVFYIITTLTEIFRCWPRQAIWDPWFEPVHCPVDVEAQNIATSVLNFISDTTILAMPQWIIWKLQLSASRKWGLSLLFVIGVGAWVFGVVRTVYFVKLLSSEDVTYQMSGVAIWTIWEITTGFLIMGIPAIPRVVKTIPKSDSIVSFFRSLTSRGSQPSGESPAAPPRQFYKPTSRRRGLWEITDLDTHDLVSMSSVDGANNDVTHLRVELAGDQPSKQQTV
ncbi:hypothetical protein BKA67DRAFT_128794 [Truncatella angustata]|uniref:Rhodopsin domain-containing protein n=1 Tax=Truncatella angustata TaxID=152316 RepID=A0A9P8RFV4_9PEZI|nr:uncharacterized protein BKA67DRAFT_128794 [Truncatella angustata]KAH6645102.1 hypothetical protein BKA67DRAFT_128794 [Truncatella angustata]KAH8200135.1 hypothetical protein TruAng_005706 [Truncatella angustata]